MTHGCIEIVHLWKYAVQAHALMWETMEARTAVSEPPARLVGMMVERAPTRRSALGLSRYRKRALIVPPRRQVPDFTRPEIPRFLIALHRTDGFRRELVLTWHSLEFAVTLLVNLAGSSHDPPAIACRPHSSDRLLPHICFQIAGHRRLCQGHIVTLLFTSLFTCTCSKRVVIVLAFIFTGTDDLSYWQLIMQIVSFSRARNTSIYWGQFPDHFFIHTSKKRVLFNSISVILLL